MKKQLLFTLFALCLGGSLYAMETENKISQKQKCYCERVIGESIHSSIPILEERTTEEVKKELEKIKEEVLGKLTYDLVSEKKISLDDLANITRYINYGANLNHCNEDKTTILMSAVFNGHSVVVGQLLAQTKCLILINEQDKDGRTALMYAAATGNQIITSLLLAHNADKNLEDNKGWTAHKFAQARGDDSLAEQLKVVELKEIVIEK